MFLDDYSVEKIKFVNHQFQQLYISTITLKLRTFIPTIAFDDVNNADDWFEQPQDDEQLDDEEEEDQEMDEVDDWMDNDTEGECASLCDELEDQWDDFDDLDNYYDQQPPCGHDDYDPNATTTTQYLYMTASQLISLNDQL